MTRRVTGCCRAHLERDHATWRMQWFARGAPGPLGTYGEATTDGWRVCGPPPRSSQSKGRTLGDTRQVAVISTRIGCGGGDAASRVDSCSTGRPAILLRTADPFALDADEQRGPGCRVQMDYERAVP